MTNYKTFLTNEIKHVKGGRGNNHSNYCLYRCPKCSLETSRFQLKLHLFNKHSY